jgi:hypothetical protein
MPQIGCKFLYDVLPLRIANPIKTILGSRQHQGVVLFALMSWILINPHS